MSPRSSRSADAAGIRGQNLALLVDDVRHHGPTTRAEVSARTGLARASLTTMVPELVAAGLLLEAPGVAGPRGGRRVAPLSFDGSRQAVICAEITVSDVIVETTDLAGRGLQLDRTPHGRPLGEPEVVSEAVTTAISEHLSHLRQEGIDLGLVAIIMPAPLGGDPAVVLASSDLEWGRFDLIASVTRRLPELAGCCVLVNDANMAAVAEAERIGDPLVVSDMLYLKSLTGIGGGAITGGNLVTGSKGIGFEPGHILARPGGRPCVCGRRGCFIAEAGPETVLEAAGLAALTQSVGTVAAVSELVHRVQRGDPAARAAVAAAGEVISDVVLDLTLTFDPARVVLGGYWADVFPHLGLPGRLQLGDPTFEFAWAAPGPGFIVPGRLGERAARIGALQSVVQRLIGTSLVLANFTS